MNNIIKEYYDVIKKKLTGYNIKEINYNDELVYISSKEREVIDIINNTNKENILDTHIINETKGICIYFNIFKIIDNIKFIHNTEYNKYIIKNKYNKEILSIKLLHNYMPEKEDFKINHLIYDNNNIIIKYIINEYNKYKQTNNKQYIKNIEKLFNNIIYN